MEIYFTNPTLSKKLEELGVESYFGSYSHRGDINWYKLGSKLILESECMIMYMEDTCGFRDEEEEFFSTAYHFSDLLLPVNAKKIWGEHKYESYQQPWYIGSMTLMEFIQGNAESELNYQEWLESELNQLTK